VLSSLEAHWTILEAELLEVCCKPHYSRGRKASSAVLNLFAPPAQINRDMEQCEQCVRKYGDYFTPPLQYLKARATRHWGGWNLRHICAGRSSNT